MPSSNRRIRSKGKDDINGIILLNPGSGSDSDSNESKSQDDIPEEIGIKLSDTVVEALRLLFSKHQFEPTLIYKIFSYFHKHEISLASCLIIIDAITTH